MFVFFRASTSPGKNPECCGKCSAPDVSKVSTVLLAVSAESGELHCMFLNVSFLVCLFLYYYVIFKKEKSIPFPWEWCTPVEPGWSSCHK